MKNKLLAALMLTFCCANVASAETITLIPDAYVDVAQGTLVRGKAIIVDGNSIVDIVPTESVSSDARVVRLDGKTLVPGLIDAHSHVLLHPYNEISWNDQVLKESITERALRASNHMRSTLMAGFTSLRDLGSEGAEYADVAVRDSLHKGVIIGPRLIVAGKAIVATGSYGPKGYADHHSITLGAEPADGADLVRVVRDQIGRGADIVKVYADYRWGPNGEARPTFSVDELKTIVDVAASSGRPVIAHASTDEAMRRATLAGVQSIEHGDGGSLKTFKLMREKNVIFCPTVAAGDAISQYRGWVKGSGEVPARIKQKKTSMENAIKAGVTICNGSDVGVFPHGDNVRELELLVMHGLSPQEVLKAATITGAELMGMKDKLGQIKKGYLADLITVEGNPLEDVSVLKEVSFVMKDGVIYKGAK
ncbi:hypothetical protein GCM10017044_20630 [Kordiimonas sediminis]|uniref:Amidohydrolase-related domain-containing protein n=1 Tax=Kordiimonas sediminis TaxID=1735581 RepID=A0A919AVH5_9PROT|nr:amidohydrolase family protein [Kordiimonas sediminis]GHF25687.1 hypothetical protein GCM10017044_20630 [Kordiimonas sediminis]